LQDLGRLHVLLILAQEIALFVGEVPDWGLLGFDDHCVGYVEGKDSSPCGLLSPKLEKEPFKLSLDVLHGASLIINSN